MATTKFESHAAMLTLRASFFGFLNAYLKPVRKMLRDIEQLYIMKEQIVLEQYLEN